MQSVNYTYNRINVVLMDSLIKGKLSVYGGPIQLPHLDAWASQNTIYTHALTACTSTYPSITSIITGRYVFNHNVKDSVRLLRADIPCIAEVAHNAGYACALLAEREAGVRVEDINLRFDVVYVYPHGYSTTSHIDAVNRMFDVYNDFVSTNKRTITFWYFIFTHTPYQMKLGTHYSRDYIDSQYIDLVMWADEYLFSKLLDDNTYTVFMSDHGDVIHYEHITMAAHANRPIRDIVESVLVATGSAGQVDQLVSTVDVLPTISEVIRSDSYTFDGISLFSPPPNRYSHCWGGSKFNVLDHNSIRLSITYSDGVIYELSDRGGDTPIESHELIRILAWITGKMTSLMDASLWKDVYLNGTLYSLLMDEKVKSLLLNSGASLYGLK